MSRDDHPTAEDAYWRDVLTRPYADGGSYDEFGLVDMECDITPPDAETLITLAPWRIWYRTQRRTSLTPLQMRPKAPMQSSVPFLAIRITTENDTTPAAASL